MQAIPLGPLELDQVRAEERRAGIDAEFVAERRAERVVRGERVGLPAMPVAGAHQQSDEALVEGVCSEQSAQPRDRADTGPVQVEGQLDATYYSVQVPFPKPLLGFGTQRVRDTAEQGLVPEFDGGFEQRERGFALGA